MANTGSVTLLEHDSDLGLDAAAGTAIPPMGALATSHLVIVDPHAPVREGLPPLLAAEGIDVLAVASNGETGEELIDHLQPDLALIALELGDLDGVVLLRRLLQRGVRSAIVLYTEQEDGEQAALAVHAGAAGIVGKRRTIADLAAALRAVASGGVWFNALRDEPPAPPPAVADAPSPPRGERRSATLSSAELRVLAQVADGRSTDEVADRLSLSPHTVRTHLRNVMRKLEASSRAHAVAIAMREAAIEL
jgi:DNA-binding NarL/FixJ family response regulator